MATIEISTIQQFVSFSNGDYRRGTSSEYLDIRITSNLIFDR